MFSFDPHRQALAFVAYAKLMLNKLFQIVAGGDEKVDIQAVQSACSAYGDSRSRGLRNESEPRTP